jgi:hypothetical protein
LFYVSLFASRHAFVTNARHAAIHKTKTISAIHHTSNHMTQTSKRRLILAAIVLFALIVFGALYVGHYKSRASHAPTATQSQIDALNDALKNGLITKSQYDAEIKKLKDQRQSTPQSQP